jgi:hypothetical protein
MDMARYGMPVLFDEGADVGIGLGIGSALAEHDDRALGLLEHVERAGDRIGRGQLGRRRVDHLDDGALGGGGIHGLAEQLGGQVEIDAAGAAGDGGADGAGHADTDVLDMVDAVGGLDIGLGGIELVELFIVALCQVDDLALGGAGDHDHGEAVDGGIGQGDQAVEEARRRDGHGDAGLLGQVAGDGGGIDGIGFVAEADEAQAFGLHQAGQVGDGNADQAIDGLDAIGFSASMSTWKPSVCA